MSTRDGGIPLSHRLAVVTVFTLAQTGILLVLPTRALVRVMALVEDIGEHIVDDALDAWADMAEAVGDSLTLAGTLDEALEGAAS